MQLHAFTSKSAGKSLFGMVLTAAFLMLVGLNSVSAQAYVPPSEAQAIIQQGVKQVANDMVGITPGSLEYVQHERKLNALKLTGLYISQNQTVPAAIETALSSVYQVVPMSLTPALRPTKTEWHDVRAEVIDLLSN